MRNLDLLDLTDLCQTVINGFHYDLLYVLGFCIKCCLKKRFPNLKREGGIPGALWRDHFELSPCVLVQVPSEETQAKSWSAQVWPEVLRTEIASPFPSQNTVVAVTSRGALSTSIW